MVIAMLADHFEARTEGIKAMPIASSTIATLKTEYQWYGTKFKRTGVLSEIIAALSRSAGGSS